MPRKTRKQPGTSGGAYANRKHMTQPVQAPTGMAYGEHQALEQSQQAAPIAQEQPSPQAMKDKILQAAQQMNFNPVPLNAPTDRPHEPVTAGLPIGAGPGREVMGNQKGLSDLLMRAAMETGSSTLQQLADNARKQGL